MTLSLIVAVADNGVIGRDNALPWHLPDDLKYFKRVTLGKPVIMGRRTFESIGRPLPGRLNVVLTRDASWRADGVAVVHSLRQALQVAADAGAEEVMVIGGADIFAAALPQADRLYLTEVHQNPAGDVYFPPFDRTHWVEVSRQPGMATDGEVAGHEFVVLERR